MSETQSELSTWERTRAGDELALADLMDMYAPRMFRHAVRTLSTREDAKDAVSIAFFELWRKRRAVRVVGGSPLPWLLNTVTNTARNLERSGRRYAGCWSVSIPDPDRTDPVGDRDESGVLVVLDTLTPRERSVVVLTILEGYTEAETATALGIPVGTVKSRLSRAKSRLRGELSGLQEA